MPTPSPTRADPDPSALHNSGTQSGSFGALPRLIADRYLLQDVIAQGGMGVVFRAVDQRLQRAVAVKKLLPDSHPDERARFAREARIAAGLTHSNIVAVHDCGMDRGLPFLVMDLIEGESLEGQLADRVLEAGPAVKIILPLARALSSAHEAGILHRDLKPGNVLLRNGVPLLTDFGLAQRADEDRITLSGTVMGTPAYMAPEQARAEELDARSDVYGLGACFYRLLSGAPPHASGSMTATLLAVIEAEPTPLTTLLPELDPALAAICHRCLEKEPERRYPSAAALADDLERWLAGESVVIPAATDLPSGWKWAMRITLAALCALGLALTWITQRRVEEATAKATAQRDQPTAETFLQRGLVQDAAGKWRVAEQLYTEGMRLTEDDAQRAALFAHRGDSRGRRGARVLQVEDYTASLALDPDQAQVLHKRGVARVRLKQPEAARRDLNRALELDPTDPKTWRERANLRLSTGGSKQKALADLAKAAELNPKTVEMWRSIGVFRLKAGDPQAALEALDRAVEIAVEPAHVVDAHMYRGILRSKVRKFREALDDLGVALRIDPAQQLALASRANVHMELKRLDEALADADRLVQVAPRRPDAWVLHGRVRQRRGEFQLALQDLNHALQLDPKNLQAINKRAATKHLARDYVGAMADYRRLGRLLGPAAKSERAQIRKKLAELERLRRASPR